MNQRYCSNENLNALNKYLNSFLSDPTKYSTEIVYNTDVKLQNFMLHVGVGGFHRSHQAYAIHQMNKKVEHGKRWGIYGVGLRPEEKHMYEKLVKQKFLYTLFSRCNTFTRVEVIDVLRWFFLVPTWEKEDEWKKVVIPHVRVISCTITEKGYYMTAEHRLNMKSKDIEHDVSHWKKTTGIMKPKTFFGFLCTFLKRAKESNLEPITVLCCDNLIHNGSLCKSLCLEFCHHVDMDLKKYIERTIAFPNSMVDRITPYTTNTDRFMLQVNYNILDDIPVVCENYIQWVIENKFSSTVPDWNYIPFVTITEQPEIYEAQKLLLLNSSHSFMSYLGYVHGIEYVFEFMMEQKLVILLEKYMDEILQSLEPCAELDYVEYKKTILKRFENHYIKDELSRIAQDGSQKLKMTLSNCLFYFFKEKKEVCYIPLFLALFIYFMQSGHGRINDPMQKELSEVKCDSQKNIGLYFQKIFPPYIAEWDEMLEKIFMYLKKLELGHDVYQMIESKC